MTYSTLQIDSEITVMHACRVGKAALTLAIITSLLAIVSIAWILPWSSQYKKQLQENIKANPKLTRMLEGKFAPIEGTDAILYIEKANDNQFENIFISQQAPNINSFSPVIVTVENGHIKEIEDGHEVIVFDEGTHYEITPLSHHFRITDFKNYQCIVEYRDISLNNNNIEQMKLVELWQMNDAKSKTELHCV